jgi:5-methylcytosine-specific restriction endonuclease McrA
MWFLTKFVLERISMQHKDKLQDAERIARRKEATARYREKNLDKCREATRKSQEKNPENKRAYDAEWKATNEVYIQSQKAYREANRDRINAVTVAWQKDNARRFKKYQREWAAENKYHLIAKSKKWREENPELQRIQNSARRARIRMQMGVVSRDIIKRLMGLQRGQCAACRCDLDSSGIHLDHIMPVAKGGLHDDSNLQLLCPTCNHSKHAKHPIDFMQEKGFLL